MTRTQTRRRIATNTLWQNWALSGPRVPLADLLRGCEADLTFANGSTIHIHDPGEPAHQGASRSCLITECPACGELFDVGAGHNCAEAT